MELVVGQIYIVRASVQEALRTAKSLTRSNSSSYTASTSCSSEAASTASNKTERRPQPRPCLFWNQNASQCTVLLFTRFDSKDLSLVKDLDDMLFPQLSQEDIFKLVVPVDSTPPLPGRRAIALETFGSSGGHFEVTSNNYVILQPMLVKRTTKWSHSLQQRVPQTDMLYLNRLIGELAEEKLQLAVRKQEEIILNPSRNVVINIAGADENDKGSSHSGSSLPITRGVVRGYDDVRRDQRRNYPNSCVCIIDQDISVNSRIHQWLNQCVIHGGKHSQVQKDRFPGCEAPGHVECSVIETLQLTLLSPLDKSEESVGKEISEVNINADDNDFSRSAWD